MARLFTGAWVKTKAWLNSVKFGLFMDDLESDFKATGEAIKSNIVRNIVSQRGNWPPLSNRTVAAKGHDTVYIDTGSYVQSINLKVFRTGRFSLTLEVSPTGEHSSGLPMGLLALWLEFGTSTIPARPLWRPALVQAQESSEFRRLAEVSATLNFRRFL